jgi:hypothetical protein
MPIGTPAILSIASRSSGGQNGSSKNRRSSACQRASSRRMSARVCALLLSATNGMSFGTARRASSITSSGASCTFAAFTPVASACSSRARTWALSSYLSRLAITGKRVRLAPPSSAEIDRPAALPAMSHRAMSTAASALITVPARPKLAKRRRAARFSASLSSTGLPR